MIVSWNWLKQYVPLAMSPEELANRLMMAMATGCAGLGSCAGDAKPPIADAAAEGLYVIFPDGPIGTPADTQSVARPGCTGQP